jgi:tetratricopeptide (TPR) repeat protein
MNPSLWQQSASEAELMSTPMVGREAEMRTARAALVRARSGRGQVLGLTGTPGIGKSRLAAEVVGLTRRLGFEVHGGACRPQATTTPYLVWHPIWRALFEVDPSRPVAEQQARLAAQVAERDGGSSLRAPLLAPVVNLPMPDSELTASLDPQTRAELLRSLLQDHLRACAATAPLLLVLEDCHWIDPASQALLEFVARNVAEQPVLIVVTGRPADAAASPFRPLTPLAHFIDVRLVDLPAKDAGHLVAQRIRSLRGAETDVPRDVTRQIVTWAGGNLFRLEELVSFLLARSTDPLESSALTDLKLPDDLQRLVLARIDQLGEGEKITIEVASVLGQRFLVGWISGSHPAAGTPEQVMGHLQHLADLDLTRLSAPLPEPEYTFKHAITREAVYQSLSARRRQTLHEDVARFIERTFPDRLPQFADALAHHYGQTQNVAKQRIWFRAAADAARAALATEAAITYDEWLLALLPPEQTGELLIELGDLLRLAARWADAERAYQEAVRVADLTGDRRVHAEGNRGLGSVLPYTRPHEQAFHEAVDQLRRAVMEFEQLQDTRGLAQTLERLAWASWELGDYPAALAASERHLAIVTEADDLVGMSAALENMGVVCWITGDHAEALSLLQRALDTATRAGDRRGVILATIDLASLRAERGDHTQAIGHFHKALAMAKEIGDRRNTGIVTGNLGDLHLVQGELGRALRCFAHAFWVAVEIGDRRGMAVQAGRLAMTVVAQGREREAEQLYARAIRLARHVDARFFCVWLYEQARLFETVGRLDQAERANREALEVASEHHLGEFELKARLLGLRLQVALGRLERGAALRELRALRDTRVMLSEQAAVLDVLWQLDPAQEQVRQDAARLYRTLYEQSPQVEYRERYERLTGVVLPAPLPLPPLPDSVGRAPLELAEVLKQLDLALGQA